MADPSKCVPVRDVLSALLLFNADFSPFAAVQWFLTSLFFAEILFFVRLSCVGKGDVGSNGSAGAFNPRILLSPLVPRPLNLRARYSAQRRGLLALAGWRARRNTG